MYPFFKPNVHSMIINLITWIIFGAVVGFLADLIDRKHDNSWLTNIIVGIVGSLVGGWIAGLVGFNVNDGFNLANLGFSVVGSLLVLFILHLVTGQASRTQ
ncbi:MAG: GlsB/YeaQ/YmgE family stress response membrane protein [Patescibacteria group bacterium]